MTVSSVYDPLGFVAPVVLIGKQILQQMCSNQSGWDSPLPQDLRASWERWRSSLFHLENLQIPHCYKPEAFGEVQSVELHNFSDASTTGYGQCSYLRLQNANGDVHCSLVMGKSQVVPLKPITIPRLELTAAVLSVKMSAVLMQELEYDNIKEFFWTDSNVVLGYILNEAKRFRVFVANPVQQIHYHSNSSQWRHVRTTENPADAASRGLTSENLVNQSDWLTGPKFLWENQIPDCDSPEMNLSESDPEVKRLRSLVTQESEFPPFFESERLDRFSEWLKAKKAVARCMKYKAQLMARAMMKSNLDKVTPVNMNITVEDLHAAELVIIKSVQCEVFQEDIKILSSNTNKANVRLFRKSLKKSSSLYNLDPFLDKNGVLCVGGRIGRATATNEFKHPIILPRKHHITQLVIRHYHDRVEHQWRGMTINEIRANGFWVLGCSSAVSYHIRNCITCRKLRSQAQVQKTRLFSVYIFIIFLHFDVFLLLVSLQNDKQHTMIHTVTCCKCFIA